MKRIGIAVGIVLVLFVALVWYLGQPGKDPLAPRYVPLTALPTVPFGVEFYDAGGSIPFVGGKVWVSTVLSSTNYHIYRYDLDQRRVLGEILNGGPALASADGTKILCGGYASPTTTFMQRVAAGLNKLWPGKSQLIKTNRVETFWVLDTRDNSAKRLGKLRQWPGTSSRWRPAPDFRRGYNAPNNEDETHSFYLCDLEKDDFEKIEHEGELIGWWDDHQIVFKESTGDFRLFDITTRKSSELFSRTDVENALATFKMPAPPNGFAAWASWNGTDYEFYFMAAGVTLSSGRSFLLKASKPRPQLALFSPDFKFGYIGKLDMTGRYYVYNSESGPSGKGGNGAVILRDLADGSEREIVPTNTLGGYPTPRIYRNSVIYSRNRTLWRVDLDSTNATRLLAVPKK